jgi:protein TonB
MNSSPVRIFLIFIIDSNGYVTNPCLLRREFPDKLSDAEKEGLKILTIMPKWVPGKQAGKKVPVRFNMPLRF